MAISTLFPSPLTPATPHHPTSSLRLHRTHKPLISNPFTSYLILLDNGDYANRSTFPSLLKALADQRAFLRGQAIHTHVVKTGFLSNIYVLNNLLRFYTVCGELGSAQTLFDRFPNRDLVSWTILISGYARMGFYQQAVGLFIEMIEAGLRVDEVIAATVFSACAKLENLELGRKVDKCISVNNVKLDVRARNALLHMYLRCEDLGLAYKLFRKMPERNIVSWNSMITGLAHNENHHETLSLFRRMQGEALEPDGVTLVGVLSSCADLGALELGEWVHLYMDRKGIRADGLVGNALVDMYVKCGRIDRALGVFSEMDCRDVYSYTSMIVGFAMHGKWEEALDLLVEMSEVGIRPNGVAFVGVLSACSHAGLVEMGIRHFKDMSRLYNVTPSIEHYGCMVDMLGRAGLLDEALEFIKKMPVDPDASIWGALLGACKIHGNVTLAESIKGCLLELEPEGDGIYVIMSNIYSSANLKCNATRMRKEMKMQKLKKTPGCSCIEVGGRVHEFHMGNELHPQAREIYFMVDQLSVSLRDEG